MLRTASNPTVQVTHMPHAFLSLALSLSPRLLSGYQVTPHMPSSLASP